MDQVPLRQAGLRRRLRMRATRRASAVAAVRATVVAVAVAVLAGCAAGQAQSPAPPSVPAFAPDSLAPAHGALFGAWVQSANFASGYAEESAVTAFERTIGRRLAICSLYVSWTAQMPAAVVRWDLQHGCIPMISWAGAPTDRIAAGAYDAEIRAQARQLRTVPGPVMLRWFAEMDLGGNRADAISPASFVAAWRHIHDIFSSVGAANVRWVWCPNGSSFAAGTASAYYPGHAYVDWIGADGYNWAPELPGAHWRSFDQVFSPFYQWGLSTGKPMLVGEFGTVEGIPGAKATWFAQADRALRTEFPAIRAVVYFESDHENFDRFFDWRVTTSQSSLAAFRAFARDPYFDIRPAFKTVASPSGSTEGSSP